MDCLSFCLPVGQSHGSQSGVRSPKPSGDCTDWAYNPMYSWITADEAEQIGRLRSELDTEELAQLETSPADIRHDLMMCRFLRGHGKKAPQALRAHLRYRRENRAMLERIRASLPPDLEEFDLARCPRNSEFEHMFATLQLPSSQGTNEGMMASLMSIKFFNLASWTACDFDHFLEWIIATIEMRSVCLHNQSLKQRRLAKCTEVRDCTGFRFSRFFSSLAGVRRFATILQYSMNYPEFMGAVLVCNLDPESRFIGMIRRLVPAEMKHKILFVDRGDWKTLLSTPQGLSPRALLRWAEYLKGHLPGNWRCLSREAPETFWALKVPGPSNVAWLVQRQCTSCDALHITLLFCSQGQGGLPTREELCSNGMAGSAWVDRQGVLLLSAELRGGDYASVAASLSTGCLTPEWDSEAAESPVSLNDKSLPRYGMGNLLTWLLVLLVAAVLGCRGYVF
eukprot:TRINITY_DN67475_c0_g1_i1.p1 TRINITY_DN67475_c0_g1~~TRINITY_DN67475_c0_g1_i1.p1  ORF type:complete len:463 (+),score=57.15 TRINITY_DN67475_c0_g1_i1:35-1390(+)